MTIFHWKIESKISAVNRFPDEISRENDSSRMLKRRSKSENVLGRMKMTKARLENDEKMKKNFVFKKFLKELWRRQNFKKTSNNFKGWQGCWEDLEVWCKPCTVRPVVKSSLLLKSFFAQKLNGFEPPLLLPYGPESPESLNRLASSKDSSPGKPVFAFWCSSPTQ